MILVLQSVWFALRFLLIVQAVHGFDSEIKESLIDEKNIDLLIQILHQHLSSSDQSTFLSPELGFCVP